MTLLDPAEFEKLVAEAISHNRQSDFKLALTSLQKAAARLQLELAISQYEQASESESAWANFEDAAKSAEYAVQIQALTYLAILATRQKNYQAALKLYNNAIGCAQEQKDTVQQGLLYYNRAKLYAELKRPGDAEKEYRRAIENDPTDPDKLLALGELYLKRGWVDKAEKIWQQAHQLFPQNSAITTDLATMLMRRGKYSEAIQHYEQLLGQGHKTSQLYEGLGTCHIALEDYKAAEKAFQKASKLATSALTFGNLGALRYAQGNQEAALRAYKQAVATGQDCPVEQVWSVALARLEEEKLSPLPDFSNNPASELYDSAEYECAKLMAAVLADENLVKVLTQVQAGFVAEKDPLRRFYRRNCRNYLRQLAEREEIIVSQPLSIFLAYATEDEEAAYGVYQRLQSVGYQPWMEAIDAEAGRVSELQLRQKMEESDVIIVVLSARATREKGQHQRLIKLAEDYLMEQPENSIFLIPLKLEECEAPSNLRKLVAVELYKNTGYPRLQRSLEAKLKELGRERSAISNNPQLEGAVFSESKPPRPASTSVDNQPNPANSNAEPVPAPLPLTTTNRQKLISLVQKVDALIDTPRTYLRTTGLPRAFVNGLTLAPNNPTVIAQTVVNKLDEHGRLEEPPYKTALGAFLEYLLESGLGKDDKDFIRKILVEQNLIYVPKPTNLEGLESILKERMQEWWRSASFLTVGAQRLRAVCRVETGQQPLGTGFLVAPDLVLTCCHVVRDVPEGASLSDKAKLLKFRFGYMKEAGQILPGEVVDAIQSGNALIEHSEVADLDFALIRLSQPVNQQFGVLPLLARVAVRGEEVVILQHPVGKDMQLMLGRVNLISDKRLRHDVNTLPGSSGSPVFDENWQALGVHRSGTEYANEGVPMAKIVPLIGIWL